MRRIVRNFVTVSFALILIVAFLVTGCTRYANEEQLTTMDETENFAMTKEKAVAEKEQEKAELQEKLAEKQDELKKVQAEKEKVRSKLGN